MIKRTLLTLAMAAVCIGSGANAHAQDTAQSGRRSLQRQSAPRMERRQSPETPRRPQLGRTGRRQGFQQDFPGRRGQVLRALQQRRQGFSGQGQGFSQRPWSRRMVNSRGAAKFGSRPFGIGQRRPGWRRGFAGAPSGNPQDRGTNGKSRIPGVQKNKRSWGQHDDAPQAKQGQGGKSGKQRGPQGKRRRGQGKLKGGRPSGTVPLKKAL